MENINYNIVLSGSNRAVAPQASAEQNYQIILYDSSKREGGNFTVHEPPAYRSVYVSGAYVDETTGHLIQTLSDGTEIDAGYVRGGVGDKGDKGNPGTTYTPAVSTEGVLSWSNNDGLSNPPSVNIRGPQGEPGRGLTILGYYATSDALDAAKKATAVRGDAYGVGTAAPYDIYIFDSASGEFVNNGPLQGAKGEDGSANLAICTLTQSGSTYSSDMTASAIFSAISGGKIVIAVIGRLELPLMTATPMSAVFMALETATSVATYTVNASGAAIKSTTKLQASALVTTISEASKDTQYPSAKAVWGAIPHPETKTDDQTEAVGMDADGKLWSKPGGSSVAESVVEIVNISGSGTTDSPYACDHTVDEINSMIQEGKLVYAVATSPIGYFQCTAYASGLVIFSRVLPTGVTQRFTITSSTITYSTVSLENQSNRESSISASSTDTKYPTSKAVWNAIPHPVTKTDAMTQDVGVDAEGKLYTKPGGSGLPTVTASDNGKFLRVVSGAWAAATVADANGVSF